MALVNIWGDACHPETNICNKINNISTMNMLLKKGIKGPLDQSDPKPTNQEVSN